jgi:hypothetical protein
MLKGYVAGPYTQGDTALNVRAALRAADELFALGVAPYVPHLTHFWHLVSPHAYEAWLALDLEWLEACDFLVRLPGFSPGADREVRRAVGLGLPVFHGVPSELELRELARTRKEAAPA